MLPSESERLHSRVGNAEVAQQEEGYMGTHCSYASIWFL